MRYTNNTQRLKNKLLLRWRHREQQYFLKMVGVVGPIIEARKIELAAALKLGRKMQQQLKSRIIRGHQVEFERENLLYPGP